jgi:hypothetical protein
LDWKILTINPTRVKNKLFTLTVSIFFDHPCKPIPLPQNPRYTKKDCSVVLAVIDPPDTFSQTLLDWIRLEPLEIILVTTSEWTAAVMAHVNKVPPFTLHYGPISFQVLESGILSHRYQQVVGYRKAKGKIILRSDDDVFWHSTQAIDYLLAPFGSKDEPLPTDPKQRVGAVMGKQL